jgi:hypothetical protein
MYCIGCGEPLRVTTGKCPACRTAIVGARLEETVALNYGTSVVVPPVCCCCLAPRDDDRLEEISSVTLRMEKRYTRVPIPWCGSCRKRRGGYGWLALVSVLVAAIPLYFLFAVWLGSAAVFVALVGGVLVYALSFPLVRSVFPNVELPGHVPECDAVGGGAGAKQAELIFRNRAFARIWRELNSGVASQAPALRWAETKSAPNEKPVPRSPNPHSSTETRARLRDQLQAGRPGLLSRVDFGSRPVGADAAAEVLGFSLKHLEILAEGLKATDRTGATRMVGFGEIGRVAARKMPDGPPFSGAIFLDLIPSTTGGTIQPIRLLPATRTNYGILPGSGATSHENFRRLVRHLKTKNPAVVIEPESVPYLEEGKGFPPALPTAEALVEYESGFGVLRAEVR